MPVTIFLYMIIFLYGIVIGSFMNVCIYRIPEKQDIVKVRSHCMSCGYVLKWYDLVPLFSYIFLGGKCRKCKTKLSIQYPLIEAANGFVWVAVVLINGVNVDSLLYCLLTSALIVLSVIDFRTYEIPIGINIFILTLGLVRLITDYHNWISYLIGFFCVSVFLTIIYYATKGRGIGGGDVKLMAVCGLVLGWKLTVLSFVIGCILGSIIHVLRMKLSGESHVLAMGPYLSMGIVIAMLWGDQFIEWYLRFY
ncbi:MAG: prepilin peptidase [Lachnospiraceae bacterium]|nr:prepilin peptidase [Lachnospiraceae bacterium]